jgi:arginase
MLAVISAPSSLGPRPPQPGAVPGTAKAPEALREAGASLQHLGRDRPR